MPYKRVDVLVEAFRRMPQRRLVVIGDGPELKSLRTCAPPNVILLGHQGFEVLRSHLQRAAALVYAAREDFGIVLAEAQSAGCPVIALGRGGAAEIVRGLDTERPTGVLFAEQTPADVVRAVAEFERQRHRIETFECRANSLRFGVERFRREFYDHAMRAWDAFERGKSEVHTPARSLRVA